MSSMAAFAIAVAIDEAGCSSDDAVVENIGVGSTQEQQLTSDNRGDPARTGVYYDEAGLLTPQNVGSDGGFVETPTRYQVDGPIYAQPLIVPSVPIGVGSTDLLLVATTKNNLYGFDARKPGSDPLWHADPTNTFNHGGPPNIGKDRNGVAIDGNPIMCPNIGNIGILSTPAVDGTTAYVVSSQLNVNNPQLFDDFYVYAIDLTTGAKISEYGPLTATVPGYGGQNVAFVPKNQIQRPALGLVKQNGKTYVVAAFSSSCDDPKPFYGWVFGFDVTNPSAIGLADVFNDSAMATTDPRYRLGGIWMSGAGPAIDPSGNIYFVSGNGDGYVAGSVFSDSAFKLSFDGGVFVPPSPSTTYFTPGDWYDLEACDLDLGSSGVTYIADQTTPMLLFGSKKGRTYLLNASDMGGVDGGFDNKRAACIQFAGEAVAGQHCSGIIQQPTPFNCEEAGTQDPPPFPGTPGCRLGTVSDGGPGSWPLLPDGGVDPNCAAGQQSWPHIHGTPVFWANGDTAGPDAVFLGGQYDYVRRMNIDRTNHKFKDPSTYTYAPIPAPTNGYGAVMSLADTPSGQNHQGVLFVNMKAPYTTAGAIQSAWPKHSGAELSFGAFYAVNATPDSSGPYAGKLAPLFTAPKNDWLLAKFTPPTIWRGSVYLATMSDELLVFGVDLDGDQIPDGIDNCPTVANTDQRNTNEDAERIKNQPLLGDACDPNATVAIANPHMVTDNTLQGQCLNILLSPNGNSSSTSACNLPMSSGLTFTGYIGNSTGNALHTNGTAGPAFCSCLNATTSQAVRLRCLVAASAGGGGCDGARNDLFPPFGGPPPQGTNWRTISQLVNGTAQAFTAVNMVHDEPLKATTPVSQWVGWDFAADLTTFGMTPPAVIGTTLEGLAWGSVQSFTQNGNSELPAPNSLSTNNNYPAMKVEVKQGNFISSVPATEPVSQWWTWGQWSVDDPELMLPVSSIGPLVAQRGGLVSTTRFTANALALIAPINGNGSTTYLVVDDAARTSSGQGLVGAVVAKSGANLQLVGALVRSGYQVDAIGLSGGASTPTVANFVSYALDAEKGILYVLTRDPASGAQGLSQINIRQSLHGLAPSSNSLSGSTFATPLALEFNNASGALFLLDRLDSGGNSSLRLLSIGQGGATQVLWSTIAVASAAFPTQAYLYADGTGAMTVALTVPGGFSAETMTVDKAGTPLRSFDSNTAITTRVKSDPNGSLWMASKTFQPSTSYWTLTPSRTVVSQLLPSICGAAWLRSVAGSSGTLGSAAAACGRVTNGGFETGDFQDWITSGASETISTTAHSGSYSAELGSGAPTNGDSSVSQIINVGPSGGTLSLWYWVTCPDTVQYDWFTASLKTTQGVLLATLVPKTCVASSGWTQVTYNLAAYAGQTVVLVNTNHDDNYVGDPTYTLLDDVSIQ